jgi:hypothetical protein
MISIVLFAETSVPLSPTCPPPSDKMVYCLKRFDIKIRLRIYFTNTSDFTVFCLINLQIFYLGIKTDQSSVETSDARERLFLHCNIKSSFVQF